MLQDVNARFVGWMASTSCLARSLEAWTCWSRWKLLDHRAVQLRRRSPSRTVDSCRCTVGLFSDATFRRTVSVSSSLCRERLHAAF